MKIINREAFLALPAGVVFQNYEPCNFGDICIKGETIASMTAEMAGDFYVQYLHHLEDVNSSEDHVYRLLEATDDPTKTLTFDYNVQGRDAMYERDQLFAVWDQADVDKFRAFLGTCKGYDK